MGVETGPIVDLAAQVLHFAFRSVQVALRQVAEAMGLHLVLAKTGTLNDSRLFSGLSVVVHKLLTPLLCLAHPLKTQSQSELTVKYALAGSSGRPTWETC